MKNTRYWEERFQTFTNTAEERKELIREAFSCAGDYVTQEAFCETADKYGYFDNIDFALDMMNDKIGGNWLCKTDSDDFIVDYGLLGDIDFVFKHIFKFNFNSENCYGNNFVIFMIQNFGLKKCIEKNPDEFLRALERVYYEYDCCGELCHYFSKEPEAIYTDIPEALKDEHSEFLEEIKTECMV